nr:hypothetical protein [Pimelobacter simplex]
MQDLRVGWCGEERAGDPRSTARGVRSAAVCQPKSGPRAGRTVRTKVPTPGRLSTRPSAPSRRSAFCTVTGLAPCAWTRARVEGSWAPAGASRIQERSAATIRYCYRGSCQ